MSPKKRKSRKPDPATSDNTPTPETHEADTTTRASADQDENGRPTRRPVRVPDPPDRRITALWVALALLWALGTPLALANLLFTFMDLQEAAMATEQDPAAPLPGEHLTALGSALIWVLVLALAIPLIAALLAALLRRKIAFIGFTVALLATALPLFLLMPPADLWEALRTHFAGP